MREDDKYDRHMFKTVDEGKDHWWVGVSKGGQWYVTSVHGTKEEAMIAAAKLFQRWTPKLLKEQSESISKAERHVALLYAELSDHMEVFQGWQEELLSTLRQAYRIISLKKPGKGTMLALKEQISIAIHQDRRFVSAAEKWEKRSILKLFRGNTHRDDEKLRDANDWRVGDIVVEGPDWEDSWRGTCYVCGKKQSWQEFWAQAGKPQYNHILKETTVGAPVVVLVRRLHGDVHWVRLSTQHDFMIGPRTKRYILNPACTDGGYRQKNNKPTRATKARKP